ncbi:hypothetical protein FRC07_015103 [Ceratobasidium sp. 392]|nr:hypothetical protein FRC07_015103 [Ceratobasidium sp. 392]
MILSAKSSTLRASTLAAATLSLVANTAATPVQRQSSGISWFQCPDHDKTQCAFFDVPRDYANPAENDTVSIFMRKFPANATAENRLGSILTNPGGPGGSGSLFIVEAGEGLSTLTDGRYDIIGFDPRGVNLTGPWTSCFDVELKPLVLAYQQELTGAPHPHSSLANDRALTKKLSPLQAAHNAACVENGNRKMLESVGTAFVVQDMVKMVEALGEDGINYWGYSYGTILGATFAAMRPDLVNRMILDGVSDTEAYWDDVWQWSKGGMADSHKTYTGLLSTCAEAGPEYCAFAAAPGKPNATQTTETLRKRMDAIFARLGENPMIVPDSPAGSGVYTASNLQGTLLGILYTPKYWGEFMQSVADIERGNASAAFAASYAPYLGYSAVPYDQNIFNRSMQRLPTRESIIPIACGDAPATNLSVNAYTDVFRDLGKISPVGQQWARIFGGCNGWDFRASQRYTGPWTIAKGLKKTKFPILFMSLDADVVTPLPSAVKMSRGFGNDSATLLIQQGYGHCTTAHPSLCTRKHVHDYFVDGKVPPNGTHCTADTNSKRETFGLNKRDAELLEAMRKVREARSKFDLKVSGTW